MTRDEILRRAVESGHKYGESLISAQRAARKALELALADPTDEEMARMHRSFEETFVEPELMDVLKVPWAIKYFLRLRRDKP